MRGLLLREVKKWDNLKTRSRFRQVARIITFSCTPALLYLINWFPVNSENGNKTGWRTLLSHLDSRDVDVVVFSGDVVAVNPAGIGGFLPHPEGRRDLGLRCVLAAISHAEALMSDVEDDSTYLVWRKNHGRPRGISAPYNREPFSSRNNYGARAGTYHRRRHHRS